MDKMVILLDLAVTAGAKYDMKKVALECHNGDKLMFEDGSIIHESELIYEIKEKIKELAKFKEDTLA